MGAWIETSVEHFDDKYLNVAPHVGAWIETDMVTYIGGADQVAPHVGAWIETSDLEQQYQRGKSLPMWERGLKLVVLGLLARTSRRSPCGSVD